MAKNNILIIFLISIFLFQCNTNEKLIDKDKPVYGNILKISCLASLKHLDPHKIFFKTDKNITAIFYETLLKFSNIQYDSIIPNIAEKWEIYNNGKNIKFYLRKNIYFHDDPCFKNGKGRNLTSDDVIFSFMRMADKKTNCNNYYLYSNKIEGIESYHKGENDSISGINKINNYIFEIRLTKAYVSFLKLLANTSSAIIPREAVEYYKNNFAKHPVGTGAFRMVKWNNLKNLQLVRNDNYWKKDSLGNSLPYLDGINIKLLSNDIVRESKFLNNKIDLLNVNQKKYTELTNNKDSNKVLNIVLINNNVFTIRFWAFSMNNDTPISKNANIRKSIALNFEQAKLGVVSAKSLAPSIMSPEWKEKWYQYNPEEAKHLIRKNDEQDLGKPIIISTNIQAIELEVLEKGLKELGLNYKIDFRQVGYYENIFENNPDIFRIAFSPSYPDLEEYYGLFYSNNIGTSNVTEYKNQKFDDLYEQSLIENHKIKRNNLFIEMEKILKADIPALYFCNSLKSYYLSPIKVRGLKDSFNTLDYSEVWIEKSDEI